MRACSVVQSWDTLSAIPWSVTHQGPLSIGFPREEYWSGLPFPFPGDLPDLGIEPMSSAMAGGFFTIELSEKPSYSPLKSPVKHAALHNKGKEFLSHSCQGPHLDARRTWLLVV